MSEALEVIEEGPRSDRCETCRFRQPLLALDEFGKWCPMDRKPEEALTEAEYEEQKNDCSGECHRYPPNNCDDLQFPPVYLRDWCGEWQAKVPPEPPNANLVIEDQIAKNKISVRVRRLLRREGIKTFGQLAALTIHELSMVKSFGPASCREVRELLARYGLHLKGDRAPS